MPEISLFMDFNDLSVILMFSLKFINMQISQRLHFFIMQWSLSLRTKFFHTSGPSKRFGTRKNCPGVQGRSN